MHSFRLSRAARSAVQPGAGLLVRQPHSSLAGSFAWAAIVGGLTLLSLASWARAEAPTADSSGANAWRAAKTSSTVNARPSGFTPVTTSVASTTHTTSSRSASSSQLKWRPAYVPQLSEAPGEIVQVRYQGEPTPAPIKSISPSQAAAAKATESVPVPVVTPAPAAPSPVVQPAPVATIRSIVEPPVAANISSLQQAKMKAASMQVPQPRQMPLLNDVEELKKLRPIGDLTTSVAPESGPFPRELVLPGEYEARCWDDMLYTWKASNLCSKPLYFEQPRVERYGHSLPPFMQPAVSSAHFFASAALLPYQMGVYLPNECVYALGYYRPGSCAPYHIPSFPISARGALFQSAFIASLFTVH